MILTARWVLPIDAPPIRDGAVRIEGGRIAAVGASADLARGSEPGPPLDLGESVLMPGLVNAHCHLDYTHLRAVGHGLAFPDWIRDLTRRKAALSPDDFQAAALDGAQECRRAGVTTVADCTDSGFGAEALSACGLRGIVYPELFGVDDRHPEAESLADLNARIERIRPGLSDLVRLGISPHAAYTVRESLFRHIDERSTRERLPLQIHLAESVAEIHALLGEEPWPSPVREGNVRWSPPGQRPVAYMKRLGLLRPGVSFVHCVQVTQDEVDEIAESGSGIVTCPRSNAFLNTGTAPLRSMIDAGARVGIGTDGACSSGSLSVLEEIRAAWFMHRSSASAVDAHELVELATLGGARALGMEGEIGSLAPGKAADLTAISLAHPSTCGCDDPYSAVVLCGSPESILFCMVGGSPTWDPNGLFAGG